MFMYLTYMGTLPWLYNYGKDKLALVVNQVPSHEDMQGGESIVPYTLNLSNGLLMI